jgi:predicted lipoprotein with Yx(FWY)xxD motif
MNLHNARTQSPARLATLFAGAALVLAACSNAGGATTAPTTAATQPPATAGATQPEATEAAEAYEVDLADSTKYGKYLTGEDGKTLYLFMPDTTTKSNCNGDCAASWPPFTLEGGETVKGGDGVTGAFGSITRDDGSKQVTYAGHPLYYYGGDSAAGDTNGQGMFNKWYLLGADGSAIMAAATSSGGYRY